MKVIIYFKRWFDDKPFCKKFKYNDDTKIYIDTELGEIIKKDDNFFFIKIYIYGDVLIRYDTKPKKTYEIYVNIKQYREFKYQPGMTIKNI